jgi:hypothetical protein
VTAKAAAKMTVVMIRTGRMATPPKQLGPVSPGQSLAWAGHSTAADGRHGNREPVSTWSRSSIQTRTPPAPSCVAGGQQGPSLGTGADKPAPPAEAEGADREMGRSEGRGVVEIAAAFGLPLPALGTVTIATLAGPLDLRGGPLEGGADLVGLDLGD